MNGTEGLEEKLQQLLSDPDSMAQIMSFAQSLGGQMQPPQPQQSPEPQAAVPSIDPGMMQAIVGIMQQLQHTDSRQEALLNALKPYLAPERREKIDRAAQIARLSRLAGTVLQNYGGLFGSRGG